MELNAILIAIAVATIAGLCRAEIEAWLPHLATSLKNFALSYYQGPIRERLSEEWEAHILSIPGPMSKVLTAAGFCHAAVCMKFEAKIQHINDIALKAALKVVVSSSTAMLILVAKNIRSNRMEKISPVHRYVILPSSVALARLGSGVVSVCERRGMVSREAMLSHRASVEVLREVVGALDDKELSSTPPAP